MTFDTPVNRIGSHSVKWDMMEALYGVSCQDGLAMWVADMEFRPPECVQRALQAMLDHGVYGYFGDDRDYLASIRWWMQSRHGWQVEADQIFTTHGLVHGTAMCIDTFTRPGDGIVLMTPVYHAFARTIKAAGRTVVECRLANENNRYEMDFAAWDAQMTGTEKMLILCSPHNPGGRVWTEEELRATADFCIRHDLILVSDEIHHDLLYPGQRHVVMANAAPDSADRLVMMTSTTKTFNIAGAHSGNVIIADPDLRKRFGERMMAMGISPNSFGIHMATAAYSPEGSIWVEALMRYLDGNRRLFDTGLAEIPGLRSMPLEATYLSWVDFSGTGMAPAEINARIEQQAKIAANHGASFGAGGDSFLRFNIACPRVQLCDAISRLQTAFADLQ
ncbi:MAG: pyridoxal phosphate-dependent aminotransferase [Tabrizicola sp.]|nr:pyridoxal phosphate-dependent aminotransferase [Tabrizicola sp.]